MPYSKDKSNITKFNKDLKYKVFEDLGIVDEKGSQYIALRRVAWGNADELTKDKANLELRRWMVQEGNKEDRSMKGCTFLTVDGPHNLAETLVERGFGSTKTLLNHLKEREDFKESVKHINDEETMGDEYFDARSALLA